MNSSENTFGSPEPVFHPLAGYALRVGRSDRAMLNHFAALVEEKPQNLLAHTRRILIAIDLQDSKEIFGALLDLFIAKNSDTHLNVRTNLLNRATTFLTEEQKNCLLSYLATGIEAKTPITAPHSRLTAGMMDGCPGV